MKRTLSKVLSCILAVMMVLSVVSTFAFAGQAVPACKEGQHVSDGTVYDREEGKYCNDWTWVTKKCTVCGQYYSEFVREQEAAHTKDDKTVVFHEAVGATCSANGNIAYYECTVCGWKCDEDGNVNPKIVVEKNDGKHEYVADPTTAVAPTMVNGVFTPGSMVYKCVYNCGATKTLPITCDHEGTYSSAIAGYDFDNSEIWNKLTGNGNYAAATCAADGYQVYQCKRCEAKVTVVSAAKHNITGAIAVNSSAATCAQPGYEIYICKTCNNVVTVVVPKLDHKDEKGFSALVVCSSATCRDNTQYKCTLCNKVIDGKTVTGVADALGHPGKVALPQYNKLAAECKDKDENKKTVTYGVAYYCPVCDEAGIGEPVEYEGEQTNGLVFVDTPTGKTHDFSVKVYTKQTTCVSDGEYILRCAKCEKYVNAKNEAVASSAAKKYTEAKSGAYHDVYEVRIMYLPTCISAGVRQIACRLCGGLDGQIETIPAKGHVPSSAVVTVIRSASCAAGGAETHYCENCKEEIIVYTAALNHVFDSNKVKSAAVATCTAKGYTEDTRYCTLCGALEFPENEIAALGHTKVTVSVKKNTPVTVKSSCIAWGYVTTKPSADSTGWYCTTCKACDGTIIKATALWAPLGHTMVEDQTNSSASGACNAYKYVTWYCKDCEYASTECKVTNFKENPDHKFTADGSLEVKSDSILYNVDTNEYLTNNGTPILTAKIAKDKSKVVASTHNSIGYTVKYCENCKNYYGINVTDKVAHTNKAGQTFTDISADSSAVYCVPGVKDYVCTTKDCSKNKGATVIHTGEAQVINSSAETCTQPEYYVYAWECCGNVTTVPTAGSNPHHVVSTAIRNGVTVKFCEVCDEVFDKEIKDYKLEYNYDIKSTPVNGGKLAVTVSVKNTKEAQEVYGTALKFNYDASAFTFVKGEAVEGSDFDVVTAVANEDVYTYRKQIGTIKGEAVYEDVIEKVATVTLNAYNSALQNVTVDGKTEIAVLYFDINKDARTEGGIVPKFAFNDKYTTGEGVTYTYEEKNVAAGYVGAYDTKKIAVKAYDENGYCFATEISLLGDLDNDGYITIADFGLMKKAFINNEDVANLPAADINGDGEITAADVEAVRAYVSGIVTTYEEMLLNA